MTEGTPLKIYEASSLAKGNRLKPGKLGLYEDRLIYMSQPTLTKTLRQDILYEQIARMSQEDGPVFSTLVVETTGGETIRVDGLKIETAAEARESIRQQIERRKSSPASKPASDNVASELEKLADLHARGVLDDEEFTAAKKRLLGFVPKAPASDGHYRTPGEGLQARSQPNADATPLTRLPGNAAVSVLERRGAWAYVKLSDGQAVWVDGRRLVETENA